MKEIDLSPFRGVCPCGGKRLLMVEKILLGSGASREALRFIAQLAPSGGIAVVCDKNTAAIAENYLMAGLKGAFLAVLSASPLHADEHAVAQLEAILRPDTALFVAVGAGTIHDIVRYAAHKSGKPFVSVPTAATVDGFVSTVAAMTWHGLKRTFPASSPIAVFADTDIFASAPKGLTASGAADMLGKYTALADWEIAHIVTGEAYCPRIARLERGALQAVAENIENIASGEPKHVEALMYGLLFSGLAMQMAGNSRPASGAEHHLSHLWEMGVLAPAPDALHGEKVGVGLAMAAEAYHSIAKYPDAAWRSRGYSGFPTDELQEAFGSLYHGILEENTPDPLSTIDGERLFSSANRIRDVIRAIPSVEQIRGMLRALHAPDAMEELGLSPALKQKSLQFSPYVRNRLTLMRLSKLIGGPGEEQ